MDAKTSDKVEQLMWEHLGTRVDRAEEKLDSFLLRLGVEISCDSKRKDNGENRSKR